ncbi:hypothetical protein ACA910_014903 [Epithemia clementina (nom. ined.)]
MCLDARTLIYKEWHAADRLLDFFFVIAILAKLPVGDCRVLRGGYSSGNSYSHSYSSGGSSYRSSSSSPYYGQHYYFNHRNYGNHTNDDYYGSDGECIACVVFVMIVIVGIAVCLGYMVWRSVQDLGSYRKAYYKAKRIVDRSSERSSAIVDSDSPCPTSGTYHAKYMEQNQWFNLETHMHFTPAKNGKGWTISGHGHDMDGQSTITEGFLSPYLASTLEAEGVNSNASAVKSDTAINAYWVEDQGNRQILSTGTFDFGAYNNFSGSWKATNGTGGRYHGFQLKTPNTTKAPVEEDCSADYKKLRDDTDGPDIAMSLQNQQLDQHQQQDNYQEPYQLLEADNSTKTSEQPQHDEAFKGAGDYHRVLD